MYNEYCFCSGKYILAKPVKTAPKKHVSKERMNPKDVEIGSEVNNCIILKILATALFP